MRRTGARSITRPPAVFLANSENMVGGPDVPVVAEYREELFQPRGDAETNDGLAAPEDGMAIHCGRSADSMGPL
jgi:hypothetical protein